MMEPNRFAIDNEPDSAPVEFSRTPENSLKIGLFSVLLVLAGVVLIGSAGLSDLFRDRENILSAKFCLPLAGGLGLILTGSLIKTKWKYFAGWTALALIGQAVSLQMINAGRLIHFQHYRPLPELLDQVPLVLVLFVVQLLLVARSTAQRGPLIRAWLNKKFSNWKLISGFTFLILTGAAVTPDFSIYTTSLVMSAILQIVNLSNIMLAVWAVPAQSMNWLGEKFSFLTGEAEESEKKFVRFDKFVWIAAIWIVSVAGFLSYFVYQAHPHVPDETQYIFQANYLAARQLTVNAPLVPEAFSMYMIPEREDRWFGIFSPGWPALLAVGVKLNAEWLVNPLLAGLCVFLTFLFLQELYTRRFARMSIFLLVCSPWFIFMSMSYMSHIFTLFCALSAAVLLVKSFSNRKLLYAFGAGLFIGILSLIRPFDGLLVAFLLGIWTLFRCPNRKSRIFASASLVIGTIATALLVFPYNKAVTGNGWLSPLDAYYAKYYSVKTMALGFGSDRGMHWGLDAFPGHSPLEALINSALNTYLIQTELFGWAVGSLILAVFVILSGKLEKKDLWIPSVIVAIVGGYGLVWYHGGPDFGARYWFLCIIPLIALTVRGIELLSQKFEEKSTVSLTIHRRIVLAVVLLCVMSLINYLPWRSLDKYFRYLEMQPGIGQLSRQNNFGKDLILIRGTEHPDYQSAWIFNPLNFEGEAPLFAFDKSPEIRIQLLKNYPDRRVWIVNGPTLANGSYEIMRGPLAANELLEEMSRQKSFDEKK